MKCLYFGRGMLIKVYKQSAALEKSVRGRQAYCDLTAIKWTRNSVGSCGKRDKPSGSIKGEEEFLG
jgi:hypothetical protein